MRILKGTRNKGLQGGRKNFNLEFPTSDLGSRGLKEPRTGGDLNEKVPDWLVELR